MKLEDIKVMDEYRTTWFIKDGVFHFRNHNDNSNFKTYSFNSPRGKESRAIVEGLIYNEYLDRILNSL